MTGPRGGFKTDPDEKGTEREDDFRAGFRYGGGFKTDPDEKGTESFGKRSPKQSNMLDVSRLIPMKRELKVPALSARRLASPGFKTDPDEKGTESSASLSRTCRPAAFQD